MAMFYEKVTTSYFSLETSLACQQGNTTSTWRFALHVFVWLFYRAQRIQQVVFLPSSLWCSNQVLPLVSRACSGVLWPTFSLYSQFLLTVFCTLLPTPRRGERKTRWNVSDLCWCLQKCLPATSYGERRSIASRGQPERLGTWRSRCILLPRTWLVRPTKESDCGNSHVKHVLRPGTMTEW